MRNWENVIQTVLLIAVVAFEMAGPILRSERLTFRQKLGSLMVGIVITHTVWRCIWP